MAGLAKKGLLQNLWVIWTLRDAAARKNPKANRRRLA